MYRFCFTELHLVSSICFQFSRLRKILL